MAGVQLKNGEIVEGAVVTVAMESISDLLATNPIAFYELVMKCRDEEHKPCDQGVIEVLMGRKLANPGKSPDDIIIHDSIRNIVLSAVEGDSLEMTLGSPFASS